MAEDTRLPATRNDAWGFWRTMDEHAEAAWPLAIVAIANATGESLDAARTFLDSRHGRHFADDVRNRLLAGDALDAAVRFATARWMAWTINRAYSRTHNIPRGLPMLLGLTIHYGLADEASAD